MTGRQCGNKLFFFYFCLAYGLGFEQDDVDDWEMSSLYNGPDNDDSLSTQDMLAFNDTTNDMLDDEMKFEDDEDD